ncbi:MAG: monothiol glutaredoxin, Grx4 family, partial [Euryarchaeota archaeon]|nr:monothiol glutaredoxin, Grx4 family [Euryarchaeota archaeon]
MKMNWTPEELQAIVDEHALVLFMKGTPNEPQCGFSNRAAQVMQQFGEPFAAVNILTDSRA